MGIERRTGDPAWGDGAEAPANRLRAQRRTEVLDRRCTFETAGAELVMLQKGDVLSRTPDHVQLVKFGWAIERSVEREGKSFASALYLPGELVFPHAVEGDGALFKARMLTDGAVYRLEDLDCMSTSAAVEAMLMDALLAAHSWERRRAVAIGSYSGRDRLIHFLLDIRDRLGSASAGSNRFFLPLTQGDIATCLGVTPVYLNRLVGQLNRQGVIEFRHRHVRILDREALERMIGVPSPADHPADPGPAEPDRRV